MDVTDSYKTLIRRADWHAAYDAAMGHLHHKPEDSEAKHAAVMCLVRAGSLEQARKQYNQFKLFEYTDHEDIVALGGRILKGLMLEAKGIERAELCRKAQEQYQFAYDIRRGTYPGINTATLALLNNDINTSKKLAKSIISDLKSATPKARKAKYYHHATEAEAWLILEDFDKYEAALNAAIDSDPKNYAARAGTLKQLELILAHRGEMGLGKLAPWRPDSVIHFTGHMFCHPPSNTARSLDLDGEERLAEKISAALSERSIGSGYGALAAGSDILIAEQLIKRGADLHIVLPASVEAFKAKSVRPFGTEWEPRFDACLAAAQSVRITASERALFDDLSLQVCSHTAMGLATLRAKALSTSVYQLAIWDQGPAGLAGTGADCRIWEAAKRERLHIPWPGTPSPRGSQDVKPHSMFRREIRAMLFTDIVGFGKIPDSVLPLLVRSVFHPLAKICRDLPTPPDLIDTWGDGIFLTFTNVEAAARAALALQDAFRKLASMQTEELKGLSLRIGGHCGPVYIGNDPFLQRPNTYGQNVVIASRIEPISLPGAVYISEPFACMLDASHPTEFQCEYIGILQSAKDDLPLPLFSLRGGMSF